MRKLKKIITLLLCTALFFPLKTAQAAENKDYWPKIAEKITAGSAILMNVDTGTILYGKKADKIRYPASITKIMTTLVAIENSSMDEVVTFSQDSIYNTEGSGIWRDVGEKMTMEECLYAVMLESANECAYAVAEHVGGTYENFIDMMNKRAEEIGCTSTHFNNPHGLPDENHYVTARDMALIAQEAYKNETFRIICGTKRYTIPPTNKHEEPTYLQNHHKMLYPHEGVSAYLYDYCVGGKTGYTVAAGNTLVTYAQKDDMTLVAVILDGTKPSYWNETRELLDFGFENFSAYNVKESLQDKENEEEKKLDTLNSNEPYAQIDPEARIILPKTVGFDKAQMKVNYDSSSEEVLAKLEFNYGKHKVGSANIIKTNTTIENNVTQSDEEEEEKIETLTEKKESFSIDWIRNTFNKQKAKILESGIWLLAVAVVAGILLLVLIFWIIYNTSYSFRSAIAARKRRRREKKEYTIIRDTTPSRGRRRRKR